MARLIRPTRGELEYRTRLYKEEQTDSDRDAFYEQWVEPEDSGKLYRLLYCGACEDFVGECGYVNKDGRANLFVYIQPSMRLSGYGTSAVKLLCEEAGKNGICCLFVDADDSSVYGDFLTRCGFRAEEDGAYRIDTGFETCTSKCRCRSREN